MKDGGARQQQNFEHKSTDCCLLSQDIEYDAVRNTAYWGARPVRVAARAVEVAVGFGQWLARNRLSRRSTLEELSPIQAERLRLLLTRLGPAYVKIGQVLLLLTLSSYYRPACL